VTDGESMTRGAVPVPSVWKGTVADGAVAASRFVALTVARLEVADVVAAAKWGTAQPIDDPAREAAEQADAADRALALRIDPTLVEHVLAAQLEASKIVQRGLFERWRADRPCAPTRRPDLTSEVRPLLDDIDEQLIDVVGQIQPMLASAEYAAIVTAALRRAEQSLDPLHQQGLIRALSPICS
jgi:chorismate mutase